MKLQQNLYFKNPIYRVCDEHNATRACVFLQCLLELWHPAVELALKFDTKLAQQTASQPLDRELQRKLWLLIAEHEIKGKNDVKQALDLLKECDLLRIEDLLPFFDDFQKIDHFKEVICDALKVDSIILSKLRRINKETCCFYSFFIIGNFCRSTMQKYKSNASTWKNRPSQLNGFEMICKHSEIVR